jgi:hypothetical protein
MSPYGSPCGKNEATTAQITAHSPSEDSKSTIKEAPLVSRTAGSPPDWGKADRPASGFPSTAKYPFFGTKLLSTNASFCRPLC